MVPALPRTAKDGSAFPLKTPEEESEFLMFCEELVELPPDEQHRGLVAYLQRVLGSMYVSEIRKVKN